MQLALNPCPQASTKVDIATRSGGAIFCLGIEAISPESHPVFPLGFWSAASICAELTAR